MTQSAKASVKVGRNGRSIISVSSLPTLQDGRVGDFAIRVTGSDTLLYGPKTASGWPPGVSLRGPAPDSIVVNDISNASVVGKALMVAATAADMQTTIGGTTVGKALFTAADLASALATLDVPGDPGMVANPYMTIWQRGTSGLVPTTSGAYTADGLVAVSHGTMAATVARAEHTASDFALARSRHYARATLTTVGTGTRFQWARRLEDLARFAGLTVTVIAIVRCSAARTVNTPRVDFGAGSGGSGAPSPSAGSPVVLAANTWTPLSRTFVLNSLSGVTMGTDSRIIFTIQLDSPADGDTFDIAYFDVIAGGAVAPRKPRHPATDLMMASRSFRAGAVRTENGARWISFGQPMRVAPSVTPSAGTAGNITVDGFELSHTSAANITYTASAEL